MVRKSIPKSISKIVFERDNWICQSCRVLTHNEPLKKHTVKRKDNYYEYMREKELFKTHNSSKATVDHIHPFSMGGENEISNYQTLCHSCNAMKYNHYYKVGCNIKIESTNRNLIQYHESYLEKVEIENESGICIIKDIFNSKFYLRTYSRYLDEFIIFNEEYEANKNKELMLV